MSNFARLLGFFALCVVLPSPALAHMPVPGIEGFYLGLAHPFVTPSHALLLLALGVLAGGFETERLREFLGAFLLGMLTGLVAFGGYFVLHEAILVTAIASSSLAALAPARFWYVALSAIALGGFLLGAMARDSGDIQDQLTVIAGTCVGASFGLLFFSAGVDWIKEKVPWHWVTVAFRIAAAWIGAISLLLLALLFSPTVAASEQPDYPKPLPCSAVREAQKLGALRLLLAHCLSLKQPSTSPLIQSNPPPTFAIQHSGGRARRRR